MRGTKLQSVAPVRHQRASARRANTGDDADRLRAPVSGIGGRTLRSSLARLEGVVPAPAQPQQDSGPVSGRGQYPSGSGRADGGTVRLLRGDCPDGGPRFDRVVPAGGYAWWYVDALSDDARHGLTLIAFVGSVFSPFYARARRLAPLGLAEPLQFCALNVALYGEGRRWAFTERGQGAVRRTPTSLVIGPNSLHWDGSSLRIDIDERTAPFGTHIRVTVRVHPSALPNQTALLDGEGRHRWTPISPCSWVEVDLSKPALRWSGAGYLDSNHGDAPLEHAFRNWTWSRARTRAGTTVLYDVAQRSGDMLSLALAFGSTGDVRAIDAPPESSLQTTRWRISRSIRSDAGYRPRVVQTLEDTPFYARSLVSSRLHGEPVTAMHESLSLDRFCAGWVRTLLPFRMRRER